VTSDRLLRILPGVHNESNFLFLDAFACCRCLGHDQLSGGPQTIRSRSGTHTHPYNDSGISPRRGGIHSAVADSRPISANGLTENIVRAAVKKEYFPNQFTGIPHDGDKVKVEGSDLTWHAVDTKLYNVNLFHFAYALGKPTSNVLFWAVTVVDCPNELKDVRLAIGSNAASVWWVNGKDVIGIYGDRQTVIDDGVSRRLSLKKGPNIVRCAVVNGGGATDFCARFLDQEDAPLRSFTVSLGAALK
jgi:hypothetical protein